MPRYGNIQYFSRCLSITTFNSDLIEEDEFFTGSQYEASSSRGWAKWQANMDSFNGVGVYVNNFVNSQN